MTGRYVVSPDALSEHYVRLLLNRPSRSEPGSKSLSSPVFNPTWFVLFCRPRSEDKVAFELHQLGYAVFLPKETVWVRIPDHKRTKGPRPSQGQPTKRKVERPLFPRYIFIGLEPDKHSFAPARAVEGVSDVVAVRGEPLRVSTTAIARMQAAAESNDHDQTAREAASLARLLGQQITIPDGLFRGFLATVMRFGRREVELEVEHAGRRLRLKMGIDAVREAQA